MNQDIKRNQTLLWIALKEAANHKDLNGIEYFANLLRKSKEPIDIKEDCPCKENNPI